ncbi:GMC family oxidoreductase [Thiofilum flexile]|uniref:GMC family oxidoreductase n=1 Tax=Thiofilum flexile TaxID=125627 RepID=UPI000372A773|nr:GMC family oxidoreductase [Thiofilum flexile]
MSLQYDFIIVGAGTAGCLLANRLSASGQYSVLLLEAGPRDNYPWIHIPVGYLYCIGNPRTDWLYFTEPDQGLNGRNLRYPRGKTLGGCSSINGMIYMRGQARDYEQWVALSGNPAWSWAQVLPDFKRHENHYRLDQGDFELGTQGHYADWHGHGGEWRIEKQRLHWDILDAFAKAMNQWGIPNTDDFNRGDNYGVGYFEVNQKSGWRWNASKAFLRPALKRPNLTVWTEATAQKLNFSTEQEQLRCTGLTVLHQGQVQSLQARREVILSAGAIGSPHLLQLSGIGARELLHDKGIAVVHELRGVGENLQDHLQIRAVFKLQQAKTLNTLANSWLGKAKIGLEYALKRTGSMSMSPSQLGAFTRSSPDQPYANLEYHVQPLSLDAFGQPLHNFPAMTASVCNLNPSSRGYVHIKTPHAQDAPAIAPNYLSTPDDQQIAAQSLRQVREIAAQPALAAYQPQEWKPGTQFQTDEELIQLAGDIATTIFHPVGTCKMGKRSDPLAVVDSELKVFGVEGLRVVDASIMPTITSGNTNSPTLMIAEKAAAWILRANTKV